MSRIAIITGANQGLGFGFVQNINEQFTEEDFIYLAVRRPEAGKEAIQNLKNIKAKISVLYLDMSNESTIEEAKKEIAEKHKKVDIIISNAAARISPTVANKDQVENFIRTNNTGTYYMIKHFLPLIKENGSFVVVASAFGSLIHLKTCLHKEFDYESKTMEEINHVMNKYVEQVKAEKDKEFGWPEWINIPSKVGQVALVKRAHKENPNTNIFSVCPGLVDTDASRPFFNNMNEAQTPYEAASHIVDLLNNNTANYAGKLIQFGKELPWN
ncbi:MAG: SDR family NAD(P)-dependent oxidoreductase [Marinifilaceae bacterium]|jgi:NAD(P)-dependent dehydrogenase (short-subunit alcohol dehydrogenase family)|nr:SDR family NAD(P)-dependent oxidoreductase [Marinifilaceae bacterium]